PSRLAVIPAAAGAEHQRHREQQRPHRPVHPHARLLTQSSKPIDDLPYRVHLGGSNTSFASGRPARRAQTLRSRPSQYGARSSRFSTFMAADSGSGSVRNSMDFGTL